MHLKYQKGVTLLLIFAMFLMGGWTWETHTKTNTLFPDWYFPFGKFFFKDTTKNLATQEKWVIVNRVVDGDTFVTKDGIKVRLIGVDTPETVKPGVKPQTYGKEASDFTKKMLTGKKVKLVYDKGKYDKYHRELAYVYLQDGTFFNRLLLQKGLARTMTIEPNTKYAKVFKQDESKAKAKGLGIWGSKTLPKAS